jgi:hypothetical protein
MTAQDHVPNLAVSSEGNRADDEVFRMKKSCVLGFCRKTTGYAGASRVDAVFQKKKSCVPGFC